MVQYANSYNVLNEFAIYPGEKGGLLLRISDNGWKTSVFSKKNPDRLPCTASLA